MANLALVLASYWICFLLNQANGALYMKGNSQTNFEGAKDYCIGIGARIATPMTEQQWNEAKAACESIDNHNCWIGLQDTSTENIWEWIVHYGEYYKQRAIAEDYGFNANGSATTGAGPWNGGEPNDYGSGEDCVEMSRSNGVYNDLPCDFSRYPLCESLLGTKVEGLKSDIDDLESDVNGLESNVDTLQSDVDGLESDIDGLLDPDYFIFVNEYKTWDEAQNYCQEHYGSDLATIENQSQYNEVAAWIGYPGQLGINVNAVWIGANDKDEEGTEKAEWASMPGQNISFVKWWDEYKGYNHDVYDCVVMLHGGWHWQRCTHQLRFACDSPARSARIKLAYLESRISDLENSGGGSPALKVSEKSDSTTDKTEERKIEEMEKRIKEMEEVEISTIIIFVVIMVCFMAMIIKKVYTTQNVECAFKHDPKEHVVLIQNN